MSSSNSLVAIAPTPALLALWAAAQDDPATGLVRITILDEKLVGEAVPGPGSFEARFGLLAAVDPAAPSFLLLQSESAGQWILYSFVPDVAAVRLKMLYAAARSTVLRFVGDARIASTIFASSASELSHAAYLLHLRHTTSDAPLTDRERELRQMKLDEADARAGSTREGRSMLHSNGAQAAIGLEWDDTACEALSAFARRETALVALEVDTTRERIVLASPQPTTLALPSSTPCYTFYRHESRVVFIYSCPSSSPIKSRLLFSSSVRGVLATAQTLNVTVDKKIETSEPAEVDQAFVEDELGPLPTLAASGDETSRSTTPLPPSAADDKSFARPSRPGRKR